VPRQQNRSLHCASLRSAPVGMTEFLVGDSPALHGNAYFARADRL
jgi:hypothetical protein